MDLKEFVKTTYNGNDYQIRPGIYCKDGFYMSVQGNRTAYCSPRAASNFFIDMEIGFPSAADELITPFAENPDDLTNTVYPYVDCYTIQKLIDKHGGIDEKKTLFKLNG